MPFEGFLPKRMVTPVVKWLRQRAHNRLDCVSNCYAMTLKKINKGSQVGHTKENILLYFETLIFLRMILSIFNYI